MTQLCWIGFNGEKEGSEKDGEKRCMRKGVVGEEGACETISSNLLFHLLSFMCEAPNIINF
jgi:hypothetical protein